MYNQLMEVMARLDAVEKDFHTEKVEHKNDVDCLNAKIDSLTQENQLLKDDNARLRSIINKPYQMIMFPNQNCLLGTIIIFMLCTGGSWMYRLCRGMILAL